MVIALDESPHSQEITFSPERKFQNLFVVKSNFFLRTVMPDALRVRNGKSGSQVRASAWYTARYCIMWHQRDWSFETRKSAGFGNPLLSFMPLAWTSINTNPIQHFRRTLVQTLLAKRGIRRNFCFGSESIAVMQQHYDFSRNREQLFSWHILPSCASFGSDIF